MLKLITPIPKYPISIKDSSCPSHQIKQKKSRSKLSRIATFSNIHSKLLVIAMIPLFLQRILVYSSLNKFLQ